MSYVYSIPQFLYDKRIHSYLQSLIDEGAKSYESLDEYEKENLVIRIIQVLGTDAYQIIIGSDNFDKTLGYFSKFLQTAKSEDSYDLLDQMRKNAIEYYAYDLEQLFDEIVEQNDNSRKRDAGLHPVMDNQTGEIEWRKYA